MYIHIYIYMYTHAYIHMYIYIYIYIMSCPKVVGGRNGYGAKLANIFSKRFTVETSDGKKAPAI